MIFGETDVAGAFLVDIEAATDERGFFAKTFTRDAFEERGLDATILECSIAFNAAQFTLRGLHYQAPPFEEVKLVRCTSGSVYDVVVDLRDDSPTYRRWTGVELTAHNRRALYVPKGCAHGYLTLQDDTELTYAISQRHAPEAARGIRWDDPAFAIAWPAEPRVISARDASYPDV